MRAVKVVAERQSTLSDEIVRKTSRERDSVMALVALKEAGGLALRGSSDARQEWVTMPLVRCLGMRLAVAEIHTESESLFAQVVTSTSIRLVTQYSMAAFSSSYYALWQDASSLARVRRLGHRAWAMNSE